MKGIVSTCHKYYFCPGIVSVKGTVCVKDIVSTCHRYSLSQVLSV